MIHYVGKKINNSELFFESNTFEEFDTWITPLHIYQHDLESNVTSSIVERKMTLAQYGDSRGQHQWVIDVRNLTRAQSLRLCEIMRNDNQIKIIHNVGFEYSLWKKYGVELANCADTMLMEKIIWCGYNVEPGFYSLAGLYKRYLFKELDKTLQTSFDTPTFSIEQIYYAAEDVKELGGIRRLQIDALRSANLLNVAALENESVCGFAEIEYNGMRLDIDAWRANIDLADPVIEEAAKKLDEFLKSNEFREGAIQLGFLSNEDTLKINWNSTLDKKKIFEYLFPDLKGITKPIVLKYIKDSDITGNFKEAGFLENYLNKNYYPIVSSLIGDHYDWLIDNDLLIPANTSTISWTSGAQALKIFQVIYPSLKSVSKEALSDCDHPIIEAYHDFLNTTKLKTTYGEKFIEEHVDSDGKVRTHFNQILNTGRVSSSKPNLQNIPAKGSIGARYRNCFISDPGWLVCSSDYASQELILIAFFSQDKVWLDALSRNEDLHSVVAEVVFKGKWKDNAEPTCKYYYAYTDEETGEHFPENSHHKCKCKEHKKLRELIKTINYMLAYGGGPNKFSSVAKIPISEAKEIIKEYFETFPGIKGILDAFAKFGVRNGYILTAKPFNRRRYYDYWEGNQHDTKLMNQISRASMNSPLQGSAGDEMKTAMCLMYWYIKDNNLWDTVKMVSVIHDECVCHVKENFAEQWKVIMNDCMEEATTLTLPRGLLKADTGITGNMWTK